MPATYAELVRKRLRARGSLGAKLVWMLTGVGLLGAAALALLLITLIVPNFNRLERDQIAGHVARTQAVLGEFASKVEHTVSDYGDWNDSYDYMARQTRAFEEDSFSTLAMNNLAVEGMAYVAEDGRVVISRWVEAGQKDVPAMRARLDAAIARIDFARALHGEHSANFYMRVGDVLTAVGIAQVRRSAAGC